MPPTYDPQELIQALAATDPARREAALAALIALGAPAAPDLVRALRSRDRQRAASAATALATIGPAALPALIAALNDPFLRHNVSPLLVRMGAAAVPAMIAALSEDDEPRRRAIRRVLAEIGDPAIPALTAALAQASGAARLTLVETLVETLAGLDPGAAIPALAALVYDRDDRVAGRAILTLADLGGEAALRPIVDALNSDDEWLATRTLAVVAHADDPGVVLVVAQAIKTRNPFIRLMAVRAVRSLTLHGHLTLSETLEILELMTRDKHPLVANMAAQILDELKGYASL